jgi:hypothetical protein
MALTDEVAFLCRHQLVSHAISRKNISKAGDIDFTNPPNTDLECNARPHAVDITLLESITRWLRRRLIANEKSLFLENTIYRSPGTGEVELVLDPSCFSCGIFPYESDNSLYE